jgi:DNA primase
MPAYFFRRWCFVLLSVLLGGCAESRQFRVEGPETMVNHTDHPGGTEFAFQVFNLDPANAQQWAQLWQEANTALNGFVSSGNYTVRFTDGKTGEQLLVVYYSLAPDLLFQHDIHLTSYDYGPRYRDYPGLPHPSAY